MPYENEDDGLALDLTPFVQAANAGADTYARVKTANANAAAIKNASRMPMAAPASGAPRGRSPVSYLLLFAAVGGLGFLGYKLLFKRRGRR